MILQVFTELAKNKPLFLGGPFKKKYHYLYHNVFFLWLKLPLKVRKFESSWCQSCKKWGCTLVSLFSSVARFFDPAYGSKVDIYIYICIIYLYVCILCILLCVYIYVLILFYKLKAPQMVWSKTGWGFIPSWSYCSCFYAFQTNHDTLL